MSGRVGFSRRFLRHRPAAVSLLFFLALITCAVFADVVFTGGPEEIDLKNALQAPSVSHPFGTDPFGRDVLSRTLHGARISLGVGFFARTISLVLGLLMGTVSGYYGRRVDSLVMRVADITLAFPALLLLIAVMAVVSPGLLSLFVTLGVVGWAAMARLVRAQVLAFKEREFVQAARAAGASNSKLILQHILPQCLPPILVVYTLGLGMTIMAEASLSFLGLGVQPPTPSWGRMISNGIEFMRTAPWLTFFPGLMLTLTICSLNLVGDGLRDALAPRAVSAMGAGKPVDGSRT